MTDLTFANLVDIDQIRELLEAHYKITGVGAGILDTDENILVAVGYHDICTCFHLVHPKAKLNCRESDAYIKAHLPECKDGYLDYRCKNGLVDVAVPIIIGGEHLATFFTGQFFYDDDKPDVEYFRNQAEKFGFDEGAYLEALDRVPVFSRELIGKTVEYYRTLVRIITGMGIQNLELRREAAELNEAKEALLISRFCIDNAGIGIYRTDENGTIFSINDHACKCLGYTEDELLALSIFDIDPVITRERMIELKEILDANGSVTHESIHRRKDGTTFPVEITANLLEFDGKTYGISFVKDITERKRAEEALLLSQYCIDKAGIGVYQNDHTGAIFSVNEQACKSLGYSKEELCALSVFDIDPEITPEKMLELGKILDEKNTTTLYTTHLRKDGTAFPVEITINILDFRGKRYGISFVKDITERKQAEEERRKSEENFSIIFQATPDLIAITRAGDGTILEVNDAFTRLLGYSRAEAIGKCTKELSIWADPTDRARWIAELEATGQVNEFETTLRCRYGSLITCISTARPLDFGGEKCVLSVVRDITERKRAEEELQLPQFCVDKASLAIYQLTEEGDIWNVNECACQSLGYSMEELRSMTVFDIDPAVTREVYNDLVSKMFACGSITFERTHKRKEGTTFPVEITANSLEFRGRKFGVCFVKDITERKEAEEALRASEAEKALILNSTMDYVMYHDPDMKIVWANRNAGKLAKLPVEDLIGRHCWKVVHKRDIPCEGCPVILARDTGEPQKIERDHINGLSLIMRAYPIKNEQGRLMGIAEFVSDITERKRAEEALRKAHDDLESRIKERTDQLTSLTAELSLAEEWERRRIATQLHDQVGQTLILSKMKLDSLSLSQPTERFEKQIREIRKYVDQSIQDIRSLTFQLSPPLLYEVGFEAAVEWLGEEFEEKYGFQVEFQDDGKKKPLDEEASIALYQMVRELLLNVAKHAKAKRVRISVGKVSGKMKINVTDDGSGFDGLNGMRDKNKKSGFGLFNIRHRIEYMGGEFRIKSKIGRGTSITLILPVKPIKKSTNGNKP